MVETLYWENGRIFLIDQRLLPGTVTYVSCDSARTVAEAIRSMVIRGAPAIGVAAAYGVALEALRGQARPPEDFAAALGAGLDILAQSRPTAVNLFWALERMRQVWQALGSAGPKEIARHLLQEAHAIRFEDIQINRALGEHGAALIPDGASVMTHCNAGALATAGHGTALGVLRSAVAGGKSLSVIATETRPLLQGARLTAWELVQEGIPVTLITDSMAGSLMRAGDIDAVIVGADRVAANGDVVNKIGTYGHAVLAVRHHLPFYVACPLSTIDLSLAKGEDVPIEERDGDEVRGFGDCRWAAEGALVRNPAFDLTPAELVTALITEKGVVDNRQLTGGQLRDFVAG
ncbi:MAG: S-methyl-5-thioribose-1-phosphate isomerase [Candidatus Adiutrix sp.]|jgi:methylthioribose-1-phosphate isomerase|nr:S-methyl-5-thioribose-1-phosphate isomerase [Candidatus Adiutrix sp.]